MDALISVIIPVYNVENYIDECLESVVGQTYKNIEIILVDDASLDNSGRKCDEWAKKDNRIVVVHKQKNEGLNMARATGFSASTGSWVSFVDSDDIISLDYVKDLAHAAYATKVDIAIARNYRFSDTREIPSREVDEGTLVVKSKIKLMRYVFVESPDPSVYMITTWCKLFKRYVIEGINWKLSDARSNEDELEAIQYYEIQKKGVVIVKKTLYYYRDNPASITNGRYANKYKQKDLSRFEWIEKLYQISSEYFGDQLYADELLYHNIMLNLLLLNKDIERDSFSDADYDVFRKNFYPKIEAYEKISSKYPLQYEEKRAFDCIKTAGNIFSFWSNDRHIMDSLRQDNSAMRQDNDNLRSYNDSLLHELNDIKSSRAWKMLDKSRVLIKGKR